MKLSLGAQFGLWIVGGFVLLGIVVEGDFFECRTTVEKTPVVRSNPSAAPDAMPPLQLLPLKDSLRERDDERSGGVRPEICEVKFTDLGILYLTYCLAVIGWFTIRSNKQTVRILERALVFTAPTSIGGKKSNGSTPYGNLIWQTGAVRVLAVNQGRTPAVVTFVHGEFSDKEPMGEIPSYNLGEGDYACDFALSANSLPGNGVLPAEWIFDWRQQFFFGFLEYRDVFDRKHTSRFCAKLLPEEKKFDIAGSAAYREFD